MTTRSVPEHEALLRRYLRGQSVAEQLRPDWRAGGTWIVAATLVLTLHGAAFLQLLQHRQKIPDSPPPPVAVMVDLTPAAAPSPPVRPNLPVATPIGAPPPASVPSNSASAAKLPPLPVLRQPALATLPTTAKPATKAKPLVTPPAETKPTAQQQRSEKPLAPTRVAPQLPTPSSAQPAPDAAASQQQAAAKAQQAAALQATVTAAKSTWLGDVVQHIAKFKRKPRSRFSSETTVVIRFDIDRSGRLLSRQLLQSGGNAAIDAEALAWIDRADPLPLPPKEVSDADLARGFRLPLQFTLR